MMFRDAMGNAFEGTENPRVHSSILCLGTSKIKDLRQLAVSPFFVQGHFGTLMVRFFESESAHQALLT